MSTAKKLKLGLPKGSLQEATIELFKKAGIRIYPTERSYYPSTDDDELIPAINHRVGAGRSKFNTRGSASSEFRPGYAVGRVRGFAGLPHSNECTVTVGNGTS